MAKRQNFIAYPVLIMALTLAAFFALTFWAPDFHLLGVGTKIDFVKDIRSRLAVARDLVADSSEPKPRKQPFVRPLPTDATLLMDFGPSEKAGLTPFFDKLDSCRKTGKKARIAYFGDSFIEGDRITSELRLQLQALFGGEGIGFLPIASPLSSFYGQVKWTASGWEDNHFRHNPNHRPLGLSGHLFYPKGSSFMTVSALPGKKFGQVRLFAGKYGETNDPLLLTIDGIAKNVPQSFPDVVNELRLPGTHGSQLQSFTVYAPDAVPLPMYGASIEGDSGVYLDNYSFRGNSGQYSLGIDDAVARSLGKFLKYDLVVIAYGINAVEHDKQTFKWYENAMDLLIEKIKRDIPGVPVLMIGVSDMGAKYEGMYKTERAVPFMVATQKKIAQRHGISFWDLYTSMGGENTMVAWVTATPSLGAKDYIHVNERGAKRIANLFVEKILASKRFYQDLKTMKTP